MAVVARDRPKRDDAVVLPVGLALLSQYRPFSATYDSAFLALLHVTFASVERSLDESQNFIELTENLRQNDEFMKIGYIRVSKQEQNEELQIGALKEAGCEKWFMDKMTRSKVERKGLTEAGEPINLR